jgi:PAS domain-containing protein
VAERRFVVEGPQAVREALPTLVELYADPDGAERHGDLLAAAPCPVTPVSREALAAMAETVSPQGVLGVAPLLDVPLATALRGTPRLVAVLEGVQDPGNAGTVIRTADAAGADAVVLTDGSTDPHGGKCVRATAGSLWHLPVVSGPSTADAVAALRAAGLVVARHEREHGGRRPRRPGRRRRAAGADRLAAGQRGRRPVGAGPGARRPHGPHPGPRSGRVAEPLDRGRRLPLRLGAGAPGETGPLNRDRGPGRTSKAMTVRVPAGKRCPLWGARRRVRGFEPFRGVPVATLDLASPDPAAYDALPDGVVVAGADGRVVAINPAAARLLGTTPETAVGRDFREVLPLVDDQGRDWWRCTDPYGGLPTRSRQPEVSLSLPVGGDVLVTASYVRDDARRLVQLVVCLRDTRARERLERGRANLVSTVAHELRSPLTSVKGFTATLLAKWDRFTDEHKQLMLQTVNADADRVTRLITELLDVSRIDAGRLEVRKQVVDLAASVRTVVEGRIAAGEARERFRLDLEVVPPDALPEMWVDPTSSSRSSATSSRTRCATAPAPSPSACARPRSGAGLGQPSPWPTRAPASPTPSSPASSCASGAATARAAPVSGCTSSRASSRRTAAASR